MGIKELENKLSTYVRLAAGGETVLVTDRDRVVAELVPPRGGRQEAPTDAVIADIVRRGWMTPAATPMDTPPPRRPVATAAELLADLEADRAER